MVDLEVKYPFNPVTDLHGSLEWRDLFESILKCEACPIIKEAGHPTPFFGNTKSKIVFVGRNPGITERDASMPFVGKTLLHMESITRGVGLTRDQVYVTNLVKCYTSWPSPDREPTPDECDFCAKQFLHKEILLLRPNLIVVLGNHALRSLTDEVSVTRVNGTLLHTKNGGPMIVFAMHHPGYFMRRKNELAEDWNGAIEALKHLLQENDYYGGWEGGPKYVQEAQANSSS